MFGRQNEQTITHSRVINASVLVCVFIIIVIVVVLNVFVFGGRFYMALFSALTLCAKQVLFGWFGGFFVSAFWVK